MLGVRSADWSLFYTGSVAAGEPGPASDRFHLTQNHPNPFGDTTTLHFDIPADTDVSVAVYDVAGRLVRVLADSVPARSGRHSLIWDGRSHGGDVVSSGVYFYRLETPDHTETRRMVILR